MPRVIRMEPEDVFVDLADSLRDMQEDFRTDVFMQLQRYIEEETQTKSAELCDRLPGDAESYRESIKFRVLEDTPERWVGELYSQHEWAHTIEDGTKPHVIEARGNETGYGGAPARGYMYIQDWLPERGGGKNSQTPPYGSKYRKDPQRFQKVEHPGARAFHIFRDTGKHVSDKIETLLSRMQTMLFEKMKRSS